MRRLRRLLLPYPLWQVSAVLAFILLDGVITVSLWQTAFDGRVLALPLIAAVACTWLTLILARRAWVLVHDDHVAWVRTWEEWITEIGDPAWDPIAKMALRDWVADAPQWAVRDVIEWTQANPDGLADTLDIETCPPGVLAFRRFVDTLAHPPQEMP